MAIDVDGFGPESMEHNLQQLAENPYPGRGIVLGLSEDGNSILQTYWVMGRSANSRNRILTLEKGIVKTEAHDPSKVEDPSLIIYNAMRETKDGEHVVSNGNQTDSVVAGMEDASFDEIEPLKLSIERAFARTLLGWKFEPDAPNYTPRITAMTALDGLYTYSIIRRHALMDTPEHTFGIGHLGRMPGGAGICLHTYEGDFDPIPPFEGSPYAIPVKNTAAGTTEALWKVLNSENRVAIVTKAINRANGKIDYHIINQLEDSDQGN